MSSTHHITVLESLPDELVIIILSYLHAVDRLRTFNNLNSRFDQCLREVGVGVNDDLAADELILNKFASRIIYIHCYKRNKELKLDRFPAIRSLTFHHAVLSQVASIDSLSMPYIRHISLKTKRLIKRNVAHTHLLAEILSGKFSWLRSIHLSSSVFDFDKKFLNKLTPCSRIRSATIGLCSTSSFELLLSYLPKLVFLKIRMEHWCLANIVQYVEIVPNDWAHYSLSKLKLELDYPFNERNLHWLEERLPALTRLEVNNRHDNQHPLSNWTIEYIKTKKNK